jgi:alpha-glucosidase
MSDLQSEPRDPKSVWWRDGIIYQIYPRSFADSNGDGVGDLLGILSKLDYLQWLGIDAIWLSPIYPSPMADFGYDVSNYHDIDPVFGGIAWEWDERTGQYYLHLFVPGQPDLNWRNSQVQAAMFGECRFWLDRGVDGFRLDVAHMLVKAEGLPDNPFRLGLRGYDRQDHSYQINQPETHAIWKEFRKLLDAYPERMAVGEVDPVGAEDYYGDGQDELSLVFNFGLLAQGWRARDFFKVVANWETRLPETAWPCWVLGNHDVRRLASRYAAGSLTDERTRVAAVMLLTLRGTPFIYYGDEIGMQEGDIPREEIVDPPGRKYWPLYKGRDGCRTPMQWDSTQNAGFSTGKPWMRVNSDFKSRSVEAQRAAPKSLLSLYRQLIALRRQSPALVRGTYRALPRPISVWAYERVTDDQRMLIALNFFSRPAQIGVEGRGAWRVRLSSVERPESTVLNLFSLAPNEAVILEAV